MRAYHRSLRPLVNWRSLPHPLDWAQVFARSAPVMMEIGMGNGDYIVACAQQSPEYNWLGVEVEWESVRRALRRCAQAGVTNLRFVLGDARPFLKYAVAPQSVQRIYTLFPCPWPKQRHEKHRLWSQAFLQLANSRLTPEGQALIITDHEDYFRWVLSQLTDTGFLAYARTIPPSVNTKYERKWVASGQSHFYELTLYKHSHCDIPLGKEVTMETYRVPRFDPKQFHPQDSTQEPYIIFKETRYDPERQIAMVRVVVSEDEFVQHFWIEIVHSPEGWQIRPAPGCGVVPTVGVQQALERVRDACL